MRHHSSRTFFLLTLLLLSVALSFGQTGADRQARATAISRADTGEAAPDWLRDSETYAVGFAPGEWDALAQSKVSFITHCPVNRRFFERAHALGIRCFPYVTFYQGAAGQSYQGINLKDHPEFIEVDAQGNYRRTGFWESEDYKNYYTICPNVQAYQDAMVAWVRKLLDLGADGVFIDNLSSRAECDGPQFGRHKHLIGSSGRASTAEQNQAFALLLRRVREVIKQAHPDGAVFGNSASPTTLPPEFWKYLDADMLESYICTWASTDRWFDWQTHWNKAGRELQPYLKAGKQIQALSYLGHTSYGVREDAFFCYASARLAGFVWNGGLPLSTPETAVLYRLRLGRPLTDEREENGVHYRVFERGLVAVNPDKQQAASFTLSSPVPSRRLVDLFGGEAKNWTHYAPGGFTPDYQVRHSGRSSIACANDSATAGSGATQTIELRQTRPAPIIISGWSRAENVSGAADSNYALYADLIYADGTHLYGQVAPFSTGTHDWEQKSVTIHPQRPVTSLTLNVLFRNKTGRVWFDDVSVREESGNEKLLNGGFEEVSDQSRILDLSASGRLMIPKYSGRVYLFAPDTRDELAPVGPKLIITTSPPLAEVRFRVDGFDYWTHSGFWTTEYHKGDRFGRFEIIFDQPGRHTVEIVDVVPADVKTPQGYARSERLGQFMDPSNPARPSEGRKFRFVEWEGAGSNPRIELNISRDTTLTARFVIADKAK